MDYISVQPVVSQVYLPKSLRLEYCIFLCLSKNDLSVRGWQSLEKPVGTVKVCSGAMCGLKCSSLGPHCGVFLYNKNTKDCTPAKVTEC